MATYLVTGTAGFIGSRVTDLLLDANHQVIGIDNLNDAYDIRLKHWRMAQLQGRPGYTFRQTDIANLTALRSTLESLPVPDVVINLAARAGVRQSLENPWVYFDTNTTGALNLLDYCRQRGVRQFVQASTSSLYGQHNAMPYQEDADTNRPLSPYAASKKAAEALCHSYHHLYGMHITVLRYFTVYGPGGRPDMSLFRFVQWISEGRPVVIYGDGKQSRDFTFVDDIARGTIAAGTIPGFNTINLGSDQPEVLLEVVHMIEKLVGRQAQIEWREFHRADVTATWADITRAKTLLHWRPETNLQQGVARLVNWYNDNRAWAKDIETI